MNVPGTDHSTAGSLFTCADVGLLRAPALPAIRARDTWYSATTADSRPERLAEQVRRLVADPLVREAILVSSPSLSYSLDTDLAELKRKDLRRVALSTTRYRLRMSTRATPFGLMAGVAPVRFGDRVEVRLGRTHRKGVRPDMGWLMGLVTRWERDPRVLPSLRLVTNDLCVLRDDRLVLPYLSDSAGEEFTRASATRQVSVRYSPAVREVFMAAARPVTFRRLIDRLAASFPSAGPERAEALLRRLVEQEILLTDLCPPLEAPDPFGYVLERVRSVPGLAELPELGRVRGMLTEYAQAPLGSGRTGWLRLTAAMRGLQDADSPVQVDLRLDADVVLPHAVAHEVETAASILWRLSNPRSGMDRMRGYHRDFLERYGTNRGVPIKEVLDPDIGLGPPDGYRDPPGHQSARWAADGNEDFTTLLGSLALRAIMEHSEIVLDDDVVDRLSRDATERPLPDSAEMYARLLSRSAEALGAGDFLVVLHPWSTGIVAGGTFGRFAYLLGNVSDELAHLVRSSAVGVDGACGVHLSWRPKQPRVVNIAQVPRWLDDYVTVGAFSERSGRHAIGVDDIAVAADPDRLFLLSLSRRCEMRFFPGHRLNITYAPDVVRLLAEITASRIESQLTWNWKDLSLLPYLPRVRYGRTILSPARWRLADPVVADRRLPFAEWIRQFERWREQWRVPRQVLFGYADHRIELNLDSPLHGELLRDELARQPLAVLSEAAGNDDYGWLGGYANELILPVAPRPGPRAKVRAGNVTAVQIRGGGDDFQHYPGGEWLYAKLYCGPEHQSELLARRVTALVNALPGGVDRWFFIRYRDPDPNLRLRFHGDPAVLNGKLLPALSAWAADLRRAGLARALMLDTYDPELERYGGQTAMALAEEVFHRDSVAVLEQLRLADGGGRAIPVVLLAALNCVELTRNFLSAGAEDLSWFATFLETHAKSERHHRVFRRYRIDALALIDPYRAQTLPCELASDESLSDAWQRRAEAATRYGSLVRQLSGEGHIPTAPSQVLGALLHMHTNRLLGADREAEFDAYAVAQGAVRVHRDRRRYMA